MPPVWIVLLLLPILGGAERFNCRGRIQGAYYADAKSGCKAFHVCVRVAGGGIRDFRFFCPPGTLFHQEAQTCTDWGDDDALACPADIYDGQFDLYKIGSGYDTKKLSSSGNRDDEAEFGLQRAETGDRRLSQNNAANAAASDLRAAHSSDFFSGQRDRGRDDPAPPAQPSQPLPTRSSSRQSFRRITTQRAPPTITQYTTQSPAPSPPQPQSQSQYSKPSQYETGQKRKLVRKRPISVSTTPPPPPPTTFAPNTQPQQFFSQQQNQQYFNPRTTSQVQQTTQAPANVPPQYRDEYVEVPRVTPKQSNRYYPSNPTQSSFSQSTAVPKLNKKEGLIEVYNYDAQSTPGLNVPNENRPFKVRNSFNVEDIPKEDFARINLNVNANSGRSNPTTVDYNTTPSRGFATSTPSYKNANSISYESEKFASWAGPKQNYYNSPSSTLSTSTIYTTQKPEPPANLNTIAYNTNNALNNIQSVNYGESNEDDGQYRLPQGEDDGQYRPEIYENQQRGKQQRAEHQRVEYQRTEQLRNEQQRGEQQRKEQQRNEQQRIENQRGELLSGAHSLNIAASGNRLPEDQKPRIKPQQHQKPISHTSVPRPFRPAPTPSVVPPQTTRAPELTYTTTYRAPTVNTQRTFDYFQTYTTTSRPSEAPASSPTTFNFAPINNVPARPSTTAAPYSPDPRPQSRAPAPPTAPPAPSTPHAPHAPPAPRPNFSNPPNHKEDASYDYAYYDSDTGFSEYDNIEEFGKTKKKV